MFQLKGWFAQLGRDDVETDEILVKQGYTFAFFIGSTLEEHPYDNIHQSLLIPQFPICFPKLLRACQEIDQQTHTTVEFPMWTLLE